MISIIPITRMVYWKRNKFLSHKLQFLIGDKISTGGKFKWQGSYVIALWSITVCGVVWILNIWSHVDLAKNVFCCIKLVFQYQKIIVEVIKSNTIVLLISTDLSLSSGWIIPEEFGKSHGCRCPGIFHLHKVSSIHGIDYVSWVGPCLLTYCQISNISHTLVGNKIVDHSDSVGASPFGTAPTTPSCSIRQWAD